MMASARGLILLGSGGWFPTSSRETCCALIRDESSALLLDTGSGLRRLVEAPELIEGVEALDIFLTHFHLDHLTGLGYLDVLPGKKRIHAPGQWLYGVSSSEILGRLLQSPILGKEFDQVFDEMIELDAGTDSIGGMSVSLRVQTRHSVPTVGIRIEDWLAYCTDTAFDEGTVPFVEGCEHLLHEAWWSSTQLRDVDSHTSGQQAATIAAEAKVEHLCLIHINPLGGLEGVVNEARPLFDNTTVGTDLMVIH